MKRRATDRMLTAAVMGVLGLIVAMLAGMPEAAILVTPWAVLAILGLSSSGKEPGEVRVGVDVDRMVVGDEVEVAITVEDTPGTVMISSVPSEGFWPDTADQVTREPGRVHDVLTSPRTTIRLPLRAGQWGVHDIGAVEVSVTEPYGLFRWTGAVVEPRLIRVHPQPVQVRNLLAPWLVRRVTGAHNSNLAGRGVEYADLRPFTSGDSLRDINWKATARSPDVWVSQRHPDRATDVVVLLDSFVESGHDVRTILGLAIEGAVALADGHLAAGDRVGLVELGGNVRWLNPSGGRRQLQRITDQLLATGLHRHFAERNLALLLSRVMPPRSFVVAMTPLLDQRFIDALFILGANGHDVAVIECAVPASPAESDEALRVARALYDAKRQMTRDRLSEHGIAVAGWARGDPLDLPLIELTRRRRVAVRGRRR